MSVYILVGLAFGLPILLVLGILAKKYDDRSLQRHIEREQQKHEDVDKDDSSYISRQLKMGMLTKHQAQQAIGMLDRFYESPCGEIPLEQEAEEVTIIEGASLRTETRYKNKTFDCVLGGSPIGQLNAVMGQSGSVFGSSTTGFNNMTPSGYSAIIAQQAQDRAERLSNMQHCGRPPHASIDMSDMKDYWSKKLNG